MTGSLATSRRGSSGSVWPLDSLDDKPLANDLSCLFPEEPALIEHAVPTRQREFATGRLCVPTLLSQL
jgi:4'-phosphopantetheinyl transferase EntD